MTHDIPQPRREPGEPPDRLLDARQVADLLGGTITKETVIRRHRSWGLTAHRVGKFLRWKESEVRDYIDTHTSA